MRTSFDLTPFARSTVGFDRMLRLLDGSAGEVPSYHVTNLDASWDVNDHWRVGLNVSNLFNEEHYEAFGGDILERRALLHVTGSW